MQESLKQMAKNFVAVRMVLYFFQHQLFKNLEHSILLLLVLMQSNFVKAGTIQLAWDASPSPGIANYLLYQSTNGVSFAPILTNNATSLTATLTNIMVGVTNRFYVTAKNIDNKESDPSNTITYRQAYDKPTAPGSLNLNVISLSRIDLNWQNPIQIVPVDTIHIERKGGPAGNNWLEIASLKMPVSAYSSLGLKKNTSYCYRARYENYIDVSNYDSISCSYTLAK
jgi:hypothetical protein